MDQGGDMDDQQQLMLMALHERLASSMRTTDSTSRLWQSMLLGLPFLPQTLDITTPSTHPLWQHHLCAWPGCNSPADSLPVFLSHLATAHPLDERSAQQLRTQVEQVENLEHRLSKERTRLQAMMQHLHMKHSPDTTTPALGKSELASPKEEAVSPSPAYQPQPSVSTVSVPPTTTMSVTISSDPDVKPSVAVSPVTPRRSRISDKTVLPISTDIQRNREFYRTNDVRPPYTYASLIRQAIMESQDCQLTLNEIYQWFTETFAYFRRNAATWKNAVRHNLSLHKCFARVEQNVKGAVWTVDDSEFYRRRPQRATSTRSNPATPSVPDASLAKRLIDVGIRSDSSLLDMTNPLSLLADNPLSLLAAASAASFIKDDVDHSSPSAPPIPSEDVVIHVSST